MSNDTQPSDAGRCRQRSAGSRCIYGAGHAIEYHLDEHGRRWPVYCEARRLQHACVLLRDHDGGHRDYVGNVWDVPAIAPGEEGA